MPHYKDQTGALHFLDDAAFAYLLPEGCVEISDDEAESLRVVPPAEQLTTEQITALRAAAYRDEADPLYFKAQRGEATMEEWLAKVEEIKARYPKQEAA